MTLFSINARPHNLDSSYTKELVLFRGLKYIWFLFLSSIIVLLAFAQTPATVRTITVPKAKQAADTSEAVLSAAFPAKHSVTSGRKPTLLTPPVQVIKPAPNGDMQLIRRVLVPNTFSYTVVQQPEHNPYYVSTQKNLVTEFGLARGHGTIGLMAHNNLAGIRFEKLNIGQEIQIIYNNGHKDRYIVSEIYRFRALEPTKTESKFQDLESGKILTANELFYKMYTGAHHLTFQTCIYASGNNSWGRLFVIANPAPETGQEFPPEMPFQN